MIIPFKRRPSAIRVRWISARQLRRRNFAAALDADPGRRVFDDKFFGDLSERRRGVERLYWKLALVNQAILVVLVLNAFAAGSEFSITGIKVGDIGRFKEFLLLVLATLSFFTVQLKADSADLAAMIDVSIEKSTSSSLWAFTKRRDGGLVGVHPPAPVLGELHPTGVLWKWYRLYCLGFLIAHALILSSVASLMVIVIWVDIWTRPNLPWHLSQIAVVYSAAATIFFVGFTLLNSAALPYRDYGLFNRLGVLREKNPAAYQRRMTQVIRIGRARERLSFAAKGRIGLKRWWRRQFYR
jgi:hypothetical protein